MTNIRYYNNLNEFIENSKNTKETQFLLVAENCKFDLNLLQNSGINFVGAIVTQVIFNDINSDNAIVACDFEKGSTAKIIKDLNSFNLEKDDFQHTNSITCILDGLSPNISTFLDSLFHVLPTSVEIVGGGAGKLTLKQEPVIFSNEGIYQDAALIITRISKLGVGVENGWEFLEGPFIVTSAQKNVLKSLNFMNSFDTYKQIVEKDSGLKFTDDNFFDIAKAYPFGIVKFDKEIVVRDPIAVDEKGNLILVGDIEQNSTVNILKGNRNSLISSSGNAIKTAINSLDNSDFNNAILFDCISRCIYLEDDFKKELGEIKKFIPNKNLFGALTLGEIANNGNEYINFYNKTCVVGALC